MYFECSLLSFWDTAPNCLIAHLPKQHETCIKVISLPLSQELRLNTKLGFCDWNENLPSSARREHLPCWRAVETQLWQAAPWMCCCIGQDKHLPAHFMQDLLGSSPFTPQMYLGGCRGTGQPLRRVWLALRDIGFGEMPYLHPLS